MKFNEKIVILRKRKGFSQEDLANELDVSRQSVYKWETGESIPDVNKIKKMVKFFNISFDDLLDDEFDITVEPNSDSYETKNAESKPRKYRPVFVLDDSMCSDQPEFDNEYAPNGKERVLDIKMKLMEEDLKEYGADSHILLQPELAACFFQNSKNLTFGFYFDEEIQFVCPYENYINSSVFDSGTELTYGSQTVTGVGLGLGGINSVGVGRVPTPTLSEPWNYELNISYFDESGNVKEYSLPLSLDGREYVFDKYRKNGEAELFLKVVSKFTRTHLKDIQNKLIALPAVGERIHSGEIEATMIDIEALRDKARPPRSNEDYYEEETQRMETEEEAGCIKSAFGFLLVAAIVIVVIIGIMKYMQ